jgi:soluble lytic murein transglycosylase-like protein
MYVLIGKYAAVAGMAVTGLHYVANGIVTAEQKAAAAIREKSNRAITEAAERLGFVRDQPPMENLTPADLAEKEAVIAGINPSVVRALMKVESGGKSYAISPKGAIGLMQIMPANHKRCGLSSPALLFRDEHNVKCGVQILAEELRAQGGNLTRALEAYNGGPQCIGRCEESIKHSRLVLAELARDLK